MDPEYVKIFSTPRRARILEEMSPILMSFLAEHRIAQPKVAVDSPLPHCERKLCFVNVDKQVD
jgi:hypothetical protein